VLLEVSGRPVFVLTGKVPMYRTLTRGSSGDDVDQLRSALRRLRPGSGLAATGVIKDSVLDAVRAWYTARGYQAQGPTADRPRPGRRGRGRPAGRPLPRRPSGPHATGRRTPRA
jgi:hypothetical protein